MASEESKKINQWTVDFSQAKIGLKNIEILLHSLTQGQLAVASKLSRVFGAYNSVLEQGHAQVAVDLKRDEQIKRQLDIFNDIKRDLHSDVAKFVGKCEAQLSQARSRVQVIYQNLTKYRSLNEPQASIALEHLNKQVPDFLIVFDAFLARFTLQLRWQNAEFYKKLGEAFTHVGLPEPVDTIKSKWWSEFQQIAQAVEALKSVHLQAGQKPLDLPKEGEAQGKNKRVSFAGEPPELEEPPESLSVLNKTPTVKNSSALSQSVKWINSKVGKEVKQFKFSDPRTGFFDKPTVPPSKETEKVVGSYDFDGETESDLSFKKGDIISVIDKGTEDDPNWWCGELDGKRGLFPKNYVTTKTVPEEKHPDEYVPRVPIDEKDNAPITQESSEQSSDEAFTAGSNKTHASTNDEKEGNDSETVPKSSIEEDTSTAAGKNPELEDGEDTLQSTDMPSYPKISVTESNSHEETKPNIDSGDQSTPTHLPPNKKDTNDDNDDDDDDDDDIL